MDSTTTQIKSIAKSVVNSIVKYPVIWKIPLLDTATIPGVINTSPVYGDAIFQINPQLIMDDLGYTGEFSLRLHAGVYSAATIASSNHLTIGLYNYRDSTPVVGANLMFEGKDIYYHQSSMTPPLLDLEIGTTFKYFYFGNIYDGTNTEWGISFVDLLICGEY